MPVFNEYHYTPLCTEDAFRLIALDPSTDEETPLTCSIINHRRSKQGPSYCAVSYTWDKPEFSRTLEVRWDGDTSYLRITPNVDALLRYFRKPDRPHYLWIDAVCLNQADEVEKAQQVPLMGRIYEEAEKVHIWLGPETEMTAKLFTFFRKAGRIPQSEQRAIAARLISIMKKVFGPPGPGDVMVVAPAGFFAPFNFAERAWFSRRWVIQEACLAREAVVHCGSCSIPLQLLVSATQRVQALDMYSYPVKMMASLRRSEENLSILELLWNFHEAKCLEPKDRIAALFGLVAREYSFPLDYAAHWTEIYKQVASFMFGMGDNDISLQVLLHLLEFGAVAGRDDNYPSWVPDWSKSRRRRLPFHSAIKNPDSYEQYPSCPGNSHRAHLTIIHGALNIHWHPSAGGPHGRKVIYTARCGDLRRNDENNTERIINILQEVFPCRPHSILRIMTLSSLLQGINEFRHPPAALEARRLNTLTFNSYLATITQGLPDSLAVDTVEPLRQLPSLLRNFCLFELAPSGLGSDPGGDYGIGPLQMRADDVMIPLWHPETQPTAGERTRCLRALGTSIHFVTMLVVRPVGEQSHKLETGVEDGKGQLRGGKIIGPAVCVISRTTEGDRTNSSVDVDWDGSVDKGQMYSITLL